MKKRILQTILLAGLVILNANPTTAQQAAPEVVLAAAPHYSLLARAAKITGDVVVEAKIDSEGKVIDAKTVEGHKLLQDGAKLAAKRWRFKPTDKLVIRTVRLSFGFFLSEKESDSETTPVFVPPYRVEVTANPPIIETLRVQ